MRLAFSRPLDATAAPEFEENVMAFVKENWDKLDAEAVADKVKLVMGKVQWAAKQFPHHWVTETKKKSGGGGSAVGGSNAPAAAAAAAIVATAAAAAATAAAAAKAVLAFGIWSRAKQATDASGVEAALHTGLGGFAAPEGVAGPAQEESMGSEPLLSQSTVGRLKTLLVELEGLKEEAMPNMEESEELIRVVYVIETLLAQIMRRCGTDLDPHWMGQEPPAEVAAGATGRAKGFQPVAAKYASQSCSKYMRAVPSRLERGRKKNGMQVGWPRQSDRSDGCTFAKGWTPNCEPNCKPYPLHPQHSLAPVTNSPPHPPGDDDHTEPAEASGADVPHRRHQGVPRHADPSGLPHPQPRCRPARRERGGRG
jgi:hypothetical protein